MGDQMKAVVLVSGRVQGVGFRYWTKTEAEALGIRGFVRNLDDGRVEAVLEGDISDVERMLDMMKSGPPHARVTTLEVEREDHTGHHQTFDIQR